ncbi:hypothetical protein DDJ66_31235 [Klebsiella oxytoca]|nr:hypothetical protein [Salmonella enterica]RFP40609.1 hypothetical protein DDJ66_31235 [Klebsiella oxytoca]RRB52268.1 hypothetical protein EIA33_24715 [Escherichia coli]
MLVRGAEPMENRQRRGLFFCLSILSHCLCLNVSVPSARRSRTTERSESVSEEAEYPRTYLRHRTRQCCIF